MASERSAARATGRRTRWIRSACLGTAASLALLRPAPAQAQPDPAAVRDGARELGREGARRYDAGDWEGARQLFRQAYRLVPAPTIAVREARALVKIGRLVEASEAYGRAASTPVDATSPEPFRAAVAQATAELEALRPHIPRVVITIIGPDPASPRLSVRLDGVPVPSSTLGVERPIDPGMHHIEAAFAGAAQSAVEVVSFQEADIKSVTLRLDVAPEAQAPAPPPPPAAPQVAVAPSFARAAGWTGIAVGGAAIALGVTTGILAIGKKSDLDDVCVRSHCPSSAQDDIDAFRTLRTVSTIGYVSGALAAGVGVTLLLTADSPRRAPPEARVETWVGAGRAGLRGTF